ncbi:uncharacterized protein M6B38_288140 [Iris pallida]|uniref:Uncharacterized protein n=1 Tax=Iris pallida TaxID=29817 RepID=A0AAX6HVC4_IRIPA|nr:uncharacterized protein M6B38_288140 [Iris pallida]
MRDLLYRSQISGGNTFGSSASGYSKGLTLSSPWSKEQKDIHESSAVESVQLVEQKADPYLQLASRRKRIFRGCTFLACFARASAGADSQPPSKVDLVNQSVTPPVPCITDRGKGRTIGATSDESESKVCLESSLKKPLTRCSSTDGEGDHACNSIKEVQRDVNCAPRRKVRWTDSCGRELVEIREFEPSDDDSSSDDDAFEYELNQRCECVIQ